MGSELIRKERKIKKMDGYGGVCDGCGTSVFCHEVIAIEIFVNEVIGIYFPFDEFMCPNCFHPINFFKVWKSLEVTDELRKVGNDAVS